MNLSDTCDRIRELLLSNDVSLDSGDASEYDTQDVERVPNEYSYGASAWEAENRDACGWEVDYRDACGEDICQDNDRGDEVYRNVDGWEVDYRNVCGEDIYQGNDRGDRDKVYTGRGCDYRNVDGEDIYQENDRGNIYQENDRGDSGRGCDYRNVGGEDIYQDNPLISLDEFRGWMNESSSEEELRDEDLVLGSSADSTDTSVPELATTESYSSDQELNELDDGMLWGRDVESMNEGATSDSGVSESQGLITNLCPTRRPVVWSRGLVTITSDRPPLSVGLSDASLNEWEDLCDLDGNPTGVEVMELNIRSEPNRMGTYADDYENTNEMQDGFDHMLLMMGRDRRLSDGDTIRVMHWVADVIVEMVVGWFLYSMAERERYNMSEWEMLHDIDLIGYRGRSGAEQGGGTCSAELSGNETSSETHLGHILGVLNDDLDGYGIEQAHSDEESGYWADIDSSSDVE